MAGHGGDEEDGAPAAKGGRWRAGEVFGGAASAGAGHVGEDGLGGEEGAGEINVHDTAPFGFGHVGGVDAADDAGEG